MSIVGDVALKLSDLRQSLPELASEVLNESAPQIEDAITAQLAQGIDGDGDSLPDYSPVSVAKYGKPPGPIKLFDKGDFYHEVKAFADNATLTIDDTNWKTPLLIDRFGSKIIALTEQSLAMLQEDVFLPGMLYKVNQRLSA